MEHQEEMLMKVNEKAYKEEIHKSLYIDNNISKIFFKDFNRDTVYHKK